MVTIYTERGPAGEVLAELAESENRSFDFARVAAISLGAAFLLSMVAAFNLNSDVKKLTNDKVPYIQQRISELPIAQR